jgi:hypothetical protein
MGQDAVICLSRPHGAGKRNAENLLAGLSKNLSDFGTRQAEPLTVTLPYL